MSTDPAGATRRRSNVVKLGDEELVIERVSGRKASAAFAILRGIGQAVPNLSRKISAFRREYAEREAVYMDRAEALYRRPDRVEHFTEADWEAAGGVLKLSADPSTLEVIVELFPDVLDAAEEHVYRLLALFTLSNAEVKRARRDGSISERLDERADELLDDAGIDELLELAVVAGEVIDEQLRTKREELGDRMGNALRLVGLDPASLGPQTTPERPQTTSSTEEQTSPETSTATSPSSRPTSSTASRSSSNGHPTPPSTPSSSSSPRSGDGSTSTELE